MWLRLTPIIFVLFYGLKYAQAELFMRNKPGKSRSPKGSKSKKVCLLKALQFGLEGTNETQSCDQFNRTTMKFNTLGLFETKAGNVTVARENAGNYTDVNRPGQQSCLLFNFRSLDDVEGVCFNNTCTDPNATGVTACRQQKGIVEYYSPTVSTPLSDLERVSYAFRPVICPGTPPAATCFDQFYLNVYTVDRNTSCTFFSCRFDFVPVAGPTGQWTTVDINLDTPISLIQAGTASGCSCPLSPITNPTLRKVMDQNRNLELGLGSAFSPGKGYAFAQNAGDTSPSDNRLVGCIDGLTYKLKSDDAAINFDFTVDV